MGLDRNFFVGTEFVRGVGLIRRKKGVIVWKFCFVIYSVGDLYLFRRFWEVAGREVFFYFLYLGIIRSFRFRLGLFFYNFC